MKLMIFIVSIMALLLYVVNATVYAPTTLEQLVHTSTAIVRGQVLTVSSSWDESKTKIYTGITVDILETIKGDNIPPQLEIVQLGGEVGDSRLEIDGAPQFKQGAEVLLFVVYHRNQWWIHSMAMGKYDIERSGGSTYISNDLITADLLITPLENIAETNYIKFDFDDFINQITRYIEE